MYRQTGDLVLDNQGLARQGVIVRHLVLPGGIGGTRRGLEWLASEVSTGVGLSLMSQYNPSYKAAEYSELKRTLKPEEYAEVLKVARQLGFRQVFAQGQQAPLHYLPDFARQSPFGP
jgi:putative pyruvate formate lyase activating enzyme